MDFGFSTEQDELRAAVRDYFSREMPLTFARAMLDDPKGFPDDAWRAIADLGWLGLAVPEHMAGSGLGLLELTLVLEEAGSVALPGPYTTAVSLALPLLLATGDDAQQRAFVPEVVSGRRRVACAIAERRGRWSADAIETTARRDGSAFVLHGTKLFVPDAGEADTLIVAARLDDASAGAGAVAGSIAAAGSIAWFVLPTGAPGVTVTSMKTVDQTRRLFVVELDNVRLEAPCLLGGRAFNAEHLDDVIDRAKVAMAAGMVGAADKALAMTVEYAGLREQFGRAIATFQAVQHRCADMKVAVEHARSLVYYAAWACDTAAPDRHLAAAMAKAFASDACPTIAADAVQLHGGIGFTWEHDLHILFKRLKADEQTYGDATHNRELVARLLEQSA